MQIELLNEGEMNSLEKTVTFLQEHQKYPSFYESEIEREIEYISQNFSEFLSKEKKRIKSFEYEIIKRIINHPKIQLDNEDDLIDLINELYMANSEYVNLYSYVYFNNVIASKMKEFLNLISYNDITHELWDSLKKRLSQEIINSNENDRQYSKRKPVNSILYSNQNFDGIVDYFHKHSNLKDEIEITCSSKGDNPWGVFDYDYKEHYFYTILKDKNPWICFEFKNHQIRPTNYTIRSGSDNDNPRNFVLEGSNDLNDWEIIDENKECQALKNGYTIHTFSIQKSKQKPFKYFRIRHLGNNWNNRIRLQFSNFEIYGEIY